MNQTLHLPSITRQFAANNSRFRDFRLEAQNGNGFCRVRSVCRANGRPPGFQGINCPPFTSIVWPMMYPASASDARNR